MLGARAAAFAVDAIWALMLTGLLLSPLAYVGGLSPFETVNPIPLLWALVMILMSLGFQGVTPGKRWRGLHVTGAGCLICRELRRMGWALVLGVEALLAGVLPAPMSTAILAVGLGLLLWLILRPAVLGASEFPHNVQVGLQVEPKL